MQRRQRRRSTFLPSGPLPHAEAGASPDLETLGVPSLLCTRVSFELCAYNLLPQNAYFGKKLPIAGTGHQNGTIRFGHDPRASALDINCRAHEVDNLYVVDASFFPSSAAVNPILTIIANALRVGDHLLERLGAGSAVR